jgi:lipopolysaccharide export system permease protein
VLLTIVTYYGFQSSLFFDMVGSVLSIVSVMIVFALLHKHSEIHPILAAGIPVYRLVLPLVAGTLLINASVIANQELLIPTIAHRLQASRSEDRADREKVEQINDYETGIMIGGKWLHRSARQLEQATFILPVPQMAASLTPLKAKTATYFESSGKRPAGWLLQDVTPRFSQLNLTESGQKVVLSTQDVKEVFIASDVSFDQLSNGSRSYRYVSTPELVRRIKNPAYSIVSIRGQILNLHSRLLRPVADLICVLMAVPLIIRKESRSLVANLALCALALGGVYGLSQGSYYLGSVNLVETDLAAWLPLIFAGALSAWLVGIAQT